MASKGFESLSLLESALYDTYIIGNIKTANLETIFD